MTELEGADTVPGIAEVETICAIPDPIVRNLRITQAYGEMSGALAARGRSGANWCTFATWASKQAGQTIRQEDLARRVEDHLGRTETVAHASAQLGALLRTIDRAADGHRLASAIREVASSAPALARASDAVARGNLKVFEEIGREFARFLAMLGAAGASEREALDRFCGTLRPGDPPDGQGHLRAAFADYHGALATEDAKTRAEGFFLANLRIGLHEQIRLQPEILEALNAPVVDPRALRDRLLERLLSDRPWLTRARMHVARWARWRGPLDDACRRLADALRRGVRAAVTETLTTLALPGETLQLGRDVPGAFPEHLRTLAHPDLVTLLAAIDPAPDTPEGSGATDWASLPQRMHFISELFRTRHETPSLFSAPFSPEQTRTIQQGRRPDGRL